MASTSSQAPVAQPPQGAPGVAAPAPPPHHRRRPGRWLPYALIVPALLLELLIHILPMLFGIWISLIHLSQLTIRNWTTAPFVGLQNYRNGLSLSNPIGHQFFQSLLRTVWYTLVVVGISWAFGMAAAVCCNSKFRGRSFFRTLFLVPYALPVFVSVVAWSFMLNQSSGAINAALVGLHITQHPPFWLLGTRAFWATVMVAIWKLWPFPFLMLLASLQNIPDDVYEAASLDGASSFRQWRNITLPMVRPSNIVVVLVMVLWTFNDFNTPFLLFGAAPPDSARLLSLHIYVNSFVNWNFGLGAALSVLLLVFLMLASVVYLRMVLPKEEKAHA
jgi:multiple sugar transport system permease protein